MNWQRDDYLLTDDPARLDLDAVCAWLQSSYWAAHRARALIEKSIAHSVCFGLFHAGEQVGFARAVTDHATFAYLCDVIITPEHRGRGLGKWMMECMLAYPAWATATLVLRTRDAHGLYERYGFERTEYLRRSGADWSKQKSADGV